MPRLINPPRQLSKAADQIWRKILLELPVDHFHAGEEYVLMVYCETLAAWQSENDSLMLEGTVISNDKGTPTRNPRSLIVKDLALALAALATKCRLSASSRDRFRMDRPLTYEEKVRRGFIEK